MTKQQAPHILDLVDLNVPHCEYCDTAAGVRYVHTSEDESTGNWLCGECREVA